jgi:hypothetical protein
VVMPDGTTTCADAGTCGDTLWRRWVLEAFLDVTLGRAVPVSRMLNVRHSPCHLVPESNLVSAEHIWRQMVDAMFT